MLCSERFVNNKYTLTQMPLCRPNPVYSLRQTNIVGFKLVQANPNHHSRCFQSPVEKLSRLWYSLFREVIGDAGLEANMGMNENCAAEDRIGHGIEGSGSEWGNRERDQTSGYETLEGPVVGAV
jgi:hypothetical protein